MGKSIDRHQAIASGSCLPAPRLKTTSSHAC